MNLPPQTCDSIVKHDTTLIYDTVGLTIPSSWWTAVFWWSGTHCLLAAALCNTIFFLQKPRGLYCNSPVGACQKIFTTSLLTADSPAQWDMLSHLSKKECGLYQCAFVAKDSLIPGLLSHWTNESESIPKWNICCFQNENQPTTQHWAFIPMVKDLSSIFEGMVRNASNHLISKVFIDGTNLWVFVGLISILWCICVFHPPAPRPFWLYSIAIMFIFPLFVLNAATWFLIFQNLSSCH